MRAYYNEKDEFCAAWLRNLISAGHIAPGEVDTRSIVDVRPADVAGYDRCHFFAGIGGWELALGLAGWPADRLVWTGSCPCQPFSAAGRRAGFADERHLWPAWFDLIRQCRPAIIFGEQVEAAVRLGWLDAVFADLEGQGYACGSAVLGAHSVGAPHIRQRLWFVADACGQRYDGREDTGADRGHPGALPRGGQGLAGLCEPQGGGTSLILGDAERIGLRGAGRGSDAGTARGMPPADGQRQRVRADAGAASPWGDAIWLPCRDGKARPTQPGLQPLVDGVRSGRVALGRAVQQGSSPLSQEAREREFSRAGTLRGAGNAIVPQVGAAFIAAYLATLPDQPPAPTREGDGPTRGD